MTSALARYEYEDFLESKKPRSHAVGFDVPLSAFRVTTILVATTTNTAAIAAKASPQIIAVFHRSTESLKLWTRTAIDWISDIFSPSECVALAVVLICCITLIGIACFQTSWYLKRYCITKNIDKG